MCGVIAMNILDNPSAKPIFLAEIGTFFNSDVERAKKLISLIAEARDKSPGIPVFLKGEVLHDPDVCLADTQVEERYVSDEGSEHRENYRKLIERKVVSLKDYAAIFDFAQRLGFKLVLSVYDKAGLCFAVEQNAIAIKLASSNLRHTYLHRIAGESGLPVIIDDGKAPLSAVAAAVERLQSYGTREIIVEHSPDGHPAPPATHNLRIIETYTKAFGLPVGLSDHHAGEEMLLAATALGYSLLEKGVVPDKSAPDQDISHAMLVSRLDDVLRQIHNIHLALGASRRTDDMTGRLPSAHMGLVAAKDLSAGDICTEHNIRFAFPLDKNGVGAEYWDLVEGWILRNAVSTGTPIRWRDINLSS